jgi:diaminopimelate epimerase
MTDQIFYTEGAGNSFFFTLSSTIGFQDLRQKSVDLGLDPDGYIVSKRVSEGVLSFDFFNKDGSLVDFCGNALRATGLCYKEITGQSNVTLKTAVGDMKIDVLSKDHVLAQMPLPLPQPSKTVEDMDVPFIMSGVPHLVFDLNVLGVTDTDSIRQFSLKVRGMDLGGAETYNLTYYNAKTDPIECVTYERGVEDFTEACGSGALSVFQVLGGGDIKLKMPGGLLEIREKKGEIFMLGPAKINAVY